MPQPGKRWRLVTIGTHGSWLPGDDRGWRSRRHKRHSSGDYKHPPPIDEHAGLRSWVKAQSEPAITIPAALRAIVGTRFVEELEAPGHRVIAMSVCGRHAHVVVELPDDMPEVRAIIGEAKRVSSRAVKAALPGCVWAGGGDFNPIDSAEHLRRARDYVLTKQGPGAWTWPR
jgi:hypothetical protein